MEIKKPSTIGLELLGKSLMNGKVDMKMFYAKMEEAGYSINDYELCAALYVIVDELLRSDSDVILDFSGYPFISRGVWRTLMILKVENQLDRVKLGLDPDKWDLRDIRMVYGEDAIEPIETGRVFKKTLPVVCTVYSHYYGVSIKAADAVRAFNDNIGDFDWVYPIDATDEDENYYPYRVIKEQAVWVRYKGYIPRSKAIYSKWIDGWIAKYDPDYIFTGHDYVPVEDVKKYFIYINGKYYRRRTLKVFCGGVNHWGLHMFRPDGFRAIKDKIRTKYKGLTVLKAS